MIKKHSTKEDHSLDRLANAVANQLIRKVIPPLVCFFIGISTAPYFLRTYNEWKENVNQKNFQYVGNELIPFINNELKFCSGGGTSFRYNTTGNVKRVGRSYSDDRYAAIHIKYDIFQKIKRVDVDIARVRNERDFILYIKDNKVQSIKDLRNKVGEVGEEVGI